jgi:hypothetical protein
VLNSVKRIVNDRCISYRRIASYSKKIDIQLTNSSGPFFFSKLVFSRMLRRAPELLARIARRGAAGIPHVGGGAGKPLLPTLGKSEERRE